VPARVLRGRCGSISIVTIALGVVLSLVALVSAAVVLGMFVWAAKKDGEEDRALQRRLGIRRRTRIGR
jgi:hypothetical protein